MFSAVIPVALQDHDAESVQSLLLYTPVKSERSSLNKTQITSISNYYLLSFFKIVFYINFTAIYYIIFHMTTHIY